MNFKIDYNFLEITNTPAIEKYFEKMVSEGWLINQIYLGSIFLFKKIDARALDFSISPYEVETAFTRKSKSEMQEFKDVSERVGWNYVTESYDLHIYYKEKGSEAIPIQTDAEEEFKTLEEIAKKRIIGNFFQIFLFLLFAWFNIGGIKTSTVFLKDGASQIILPMIGIGLTISIWYIFHMRQFLKMNRENMAQGKQIEYSRSLYVIPMITFFTGGFFVTLLVFYFLYLALFLKNQVSLIFFLIILIGGGLGLAYRFFVKPADIPLKKKKWGWIITILLAFIIGASLGFTNLSGALMNSEEQLDVEKFKVLASEEYEDPSFIQNFSLFVPKSYDFYYINEADEFILTEYSKALTKGVAINLIERYLGEKNKDYSLWYDEELTAYFEEGYYNDYLSNIGITENDLIRLKGHEPKEAKKMAIELLKERAITVADEKLWNADEAYYLSYAKDELLIRSGREVFYLEGKDFANAAISHQTKEQLQLTE